MEKRDELIEMERYLSLIHFAKDEIKLYEQLYVSQDSVSKIEKTFPAAFVVIKMSMFSSILTRVSACMEKEGSEKQGFNISLDRMFSLFSEYVDVDQRQRLDALKAKYENLRIKKFRNKLIAHNDSTTAFSVEEYAHNIQPGSLYDLMDQAYSLVLSVFQRLPEFEHFELSVPPPQIPPGKDGYALLSAVYKGVYG
ncbi:hypothetical protein [Pseudomonas nitroreducens]|uniref:AbiU2 domain-containing protein n=1 Tax=Pseudomonas nitroreducens TaxID=46680 RepID=UPI003CC82143